MTSDVKSVPIHTADVTENIGSGLRADVRVGGVLAEAFRRVGVEVGRLRTV